VNEQANAVELSAEERAEGLEMLRAMHEIRLFEQECGRLFARGEVRGTTHLCEGQEAVSVGACRALREGDSMTCTYRGHGATLAMGAPLDESFGEIFGRAQGLCGGKGGSMHLADMRVGALGSHAIVGAHLPIANGAAFEAVYRGTGAVHVTFFGDGSTNIGAFHESMNLAAIWKLPVVFMCENNLYGEYSPLPTTTPIERLADRAAAYGMPGERIDGNRVLEVRDAVAAAAERARAGEGPTLIEAMTYRHKGHSRSDPATYRPEGELEEWLARDPIKLHAEWLAAAGVEQGEIDAAEEAARAAVGEALERARSWPEPEADALHEDVWAAR
jgi:acetoin:2,6-dichlorophenolindophenol oxidoreductase subunit alpha